MRTSIPKKRVRVRIRGRRVVELVLPPSFERSGTVQVLKNDVKKTKPLKSNIYMLVHSS